MKESLEMIFKTIENNKSIEKEEENVTEKIGISEEEFMNRMVEINDRLNSIEKSLSEFNKNNESKGEEVNGD